MSGSSSEYFSLMTWRINFTDGKSKPSPESGFFFLSLHFLNSSWTISRMSALCEGRNFSKKSFLRFSLGSVFKYLWVPYSWMMPSKVFLLGPSILDVTLIAPYIDIPIMRTKNCKFWIEKTFLSKTNTVLGVHTFRKILSDWSGWSIFWITFHGNLKM